RSRRSASPRWRDRARRASFRLPCETSLSVSVPVSKTGLISLYRRSSWCAVGDRSALHLPQRGEAQHVRLARVEGVLVDHLDRRRTEGPTVTAAGCEYVLDGLPCSLGGDSSALRVLPGRNGGAGYTAPADAIPHPQLPS